jgi:hypothetical protein
MQKEPAHEVEQQLEKVAEGSAKEPAPPSNHIENPEKALLDLFRESKESRQAFIIQIYFYGGIAVIALCAAIFLMMYLV